LIVTQIEIDLCFDIIYQHTKFELNRCSLSKVIERTPNFDDGQTDGRTGVTLNAPPPFFEWWGHKKHKKHWVCAQGIVKFAGVLQIVEIIQY